MPLPIQSDQLLSQKTHMVINVPWKTRKFTLARKKMLTTFNAFEGDRSENVSSACVTPLWLIDLPQVLQIKSNLVQIFYGWKLRAVSEHLGWLCVHTYTHTHKHKHQWIALAVVTKQISSFDFSILSAYAFFWNCCLFVEKKEKINIRKWKQNARVCCASREINWVWWWW